MAETNIPAVASEGGDEIQRVRNILDQSSNLRLTPSWITIPEHHGPSKTGGQGSVVMGSLTLPDDVQSTSPPLRVAVKKMAWKCNDPEATLKFFKTFANEIRLMSTLNHPNIAVLVGFVEELETGDAWLVMPWEENGNLREFLLSGEWDVPERIFLIQNVAKGVAYLHSRDPPICHGDLKSLNILINSEYRAVITDFGSSRARSKSELQETPKGKLTLTASDEDDPALPACFKAELNSSNDELTLTGPGFSTRWTAPEVLDDGVQDLPSDMWALGWICWEAVTGRLPFDELHTDGSIILHTITGKLPRIRENLQFAYIRKLCSLMSDCWLFEPEDRIDAPAFEAKVHAMPSTNPSGDAADGRKTRSARLLLELGRMHLLQDDEEMAESYYQQALEVSTRTNDALAMGSAFSGLGNTYRQRSMFERAVNLFEKAYAIQARLEDKYGAGNTLIILAESYSNLGKSSEAEKTLLDALEICSRIDHALGIANVLSGLARIYVSQSRLKDAEKAYTKALTVYSNTGNELGLGNTLEGLGEVYQTQSRLVESEKAFQEARAVHLRVGNDSGAVSCLMALAQLYHAEGRHNESEQALTAVHAAYSRIQNKFRAAMALAKLGKTFLDMSKLTEAESALFEAHAMFSRTNNDRYAADTLIDLGETYRFQLKISSAEKAVLDAQAKYSQIGDERGLARALGVLGRIYSTPGVPREHDAERVLLESRTIHARTGDEDGVAFALHSLGRLYNAQSKANDAERALSSAHDIYSRLGRERNAADALVDLGKLYDATSRGIKAENAFLEALAIHSRLNNRIGIASARDGLGYVYLARTDYKNAERAFMEAQAVYSRLGQDLGQGIGLHGLAETYRMQSKNDEAEKTYLHCIEIHSRIGSDLGVANALDGLAAISIARFNYRDAEKALVKACGLYTRAGKHSRAGAAYHKLGILQVADSRYQAAIESYQQAIDAYDRAEDGRTRAQILVRLGETYLLCGQYSKAESVVSEALAISISIDDEQGVASASRLLESISHITPSLIDSSDISASNGMDEISLAGLNLAGPDKREEPDTVSEEPSEEEESLRMAQAMAISMGDVQGEADALFRLGEMYSWAWKLPVAEEHYAEARRKFHSIGKDIGELMALDGMMDAALFQRKFDAVRQYHADASQLYDRTGLPMSKVCSSILDHLEIFQDPMMASVIANVSRIKFTRNRGSP